MGGEGWRRDKKGAGLVPGSGLAGVELGQGALRDPLQHLFGEDSQQLPADVQGLIHRPVVIRAWERQGTPEFTLAGTVTQPHTSSTRDTETELDF